MISLIIDTTRSDFEAHVFKEGEIIHLKVKSCYMQAPDKWRLETENITPLPGYEPTGYACGICGIIEAAKDDGSLPDGWISSAPNLDGSFHWICDNDKCQNV